MKALRLTEEQLQDIKNKNEARKKSPVLAESAPKLIIQILLNDIKVAKLPEPTLEYRFHPVRKWRLDLAWIDALVSLEVEGGIWIQGRHSRGAGMEADMEKYNEAQVLGWRVLRYSTGQIKQGKPIDDLKRVLG